MANCFLCLYFSIWISSSILQECVAIPQRRDDLWGLGNFPQQAFFVWVLPRHCLPLEIHLVFPRRWSVFVQMAPTPKADVNICSTSENCVDDNIIYLRISKFLFSFFSNEERKYEYFFSIVSFSSIRLAYMSISHSTGGRH